MVNQGEPRFARFCLQYASLTLLYYDYALTFPQELRYIWTRKFSFGTVLYIFTRYALVANLLYLLYLVGLTGKNYTTWVIVVSLLSILGRVSIFIIWTTRTWIVWERHWVVLAILAPLAVLVTVLDVLAPFIKGTKAIEDALTLSSLVFEWIVLLLTSFKCLRSIFLSRGLPGGAEIYKEILQHGLLYIAAVSAMKTVSFILNAQATGFAQRRLLNAFILPVSGLLTARLVLQMHALVGQDDQRVIRTDGVERSIQTQHSVLAFGKPPEHGASGSSGGSFPTQDHNGIELAVVTPGYSKSHNENV